MRLYFSLLQRTLPSPQEKGDREAVEEVLHCGRLCRKPHSRPNTSPAIAALGTPGDATGIPR